MKLNFNKEMILKHRFWVMAGVAVVLIFTGLLHLLVSVDSDSEMTAHAGVLKKLESVKGPFDGPSGIESKEKMAKKAGDAADKVWKASYDVQEPLFLWAKAVEDEFDFARGKFSLNIDVDPAANVKDPKSWPPDSNILMHGILQDQKETYFTAKNRDGKLVKFSNTEHHKTVNVSGLPKPLPFSELERKYAGKLLAVKYQVGRYFNDPLTGPQRDMFADKYNEQIHEILQTVDPLDEKGNGVVQLKNWLYNPEELPPPEKSGFIRFVTKQWDKSSDFSKEAWIAEENIWIQKEIYRLIRDANSSISTFSGIGGAEKNKTYLFTNSYFELTLSLDNKSELSFTIKNRLPRRQKLDLSFRVRMNKQTAFEPETIRVSGLPLSPIGDKEKKDTLRLTFPLQAKGAPRQGIFGVEQVLSWETAAVKRIDQVSIASNDASDTSHSHKTFAEGLRRLDLDDLDEGAQPVKVGPGVRPGGPAGFMPKGKFGPGPAQGAGNNKGILPHELWKDRYMEVSDQSRRLPVCVALIVDQAHVDRVLTAFENSKLRFLTTQVLLNQFTNSLAPPVAEPNAVANPNPFGPRANPFAPAPAPVPGGGQSLDTNMELVIYGIMTLYQRYPPRPPELMNLIVPAKKL